MSSSREDSPDWMRSFQETKSSVWISSDSESNSDNCTKKEDYIDDEESSGEREEDGHAISSKSKGKPRSNNVSAQISPRKLMKLKDHLSVKEKKIDDDKNKGENAINCSILEAAVKDRHVEPHINLQVSSSRLPLVLSDKVNESKALVECEGDSIDLSGDMGAVGRVIISDAPSASRELHLDLKGTIYRTTIVPSRTFCIVSFGQSEAKIEAVMNDFIQLKPQSNVGEAETMVEGTLDGSLFDSEDEAEKIPKTITRTTDQTEGVGEETKRKNKTNKAAAPGVTRKRGKTGGKLPPAKKARRKPHVSKTAKARK